MITPPPKQTEDTLVVYDREVQEFRSAEATFNLVERDDPYRFELTFYCSTIPIDGICHHPNLEVTIVTESKPKLTEGQTWSHQPAYIDQENIWNVTNYYEWTHEGFDDFTVSIHGLRESSMLCEITGHVRLNRQELTKTQVVVWAWFTHNSNTKRSVW